mgnify:CR=1 FL=1
MGFDRFSGFFIQPGNFRCQQMRITANRDGGQFFQVQPQGVVFLQTGQQLGQCAGIEFLIRIIGILQ